MDVTDDKVAEVGERSDDRVDVGMPNDSTSTGSISLSTILGTRDIGDSLVDGMTRGLDSGRLGIVSIVEGGLVLEAMLMRSLSSSSIGVSTGGVETETVEGKDGRLGVLTDGVLTGCGVTTGVPGLEELMLDGPTLDGLVLSAFVLNDTGVVLRDFVLDGHSSAVSNRVDGSLEHTSAVSNSVHNSAVS